jgi:hypothetical protein
MLAQDQPVENVIKPPAYFNQIPVIVFSTLGHVIQEDFSHIINCNSASVARLLFRYQKLVAARASFNIHFL